GPGSGSAAAPSTAKAPATSNTPAPKAPAAPTGDNTVTVAGTQRTPGRVQQYANGYVYTVNYGDTLYDICAHFYGNGDLWKELQAVNQENLNATTDDMIFVGFNLILPNELGGASIR
ncbi:MAG TPA: hypothetical protein DEQ14_06885, partial [Treponema sp.]|nr:hypothetical protein [Treponema sp.]